ncbi:MAG: 2-amino-4-hydroxy-6-hydroxymethyldihydropteridine diphosphokinase [Nitrospinae bacterium]|nr:2-amino-4-hydroxy-6-hydroxymethyldihydropteridine diphosphokinase [Nitrospinota bacterium]
MNVTAYLGLGSNLGDRLLYLNKGVKALSEYGEIKITHLSSIYETEPVGLMSQGMFLNMALSCNVFCTPNQLLKCCKDIEHKVGREKTVRWGPRKLDIDILLFGEKCISTEMLEVPHPELLKRNFVLVPLNEIAPSLEIPGVGISVHDAMNNCIDSKKVAKIKVN